MKNQPKVNIVGPQYISFFHNSDEYREEFTHRDAGRPCFYWFSDRFHSHTGLKTKDQYFYLFIKNPATDTIAMRARQGSNLDFNDLYSNFLDYKNNRIPKVESGEWHYAEPPILMSFDKITPNVIAKYDPKTNEYEVIKPVSHALVRFKLYDDRYKHIWAIGIPFIKVPKLVDMFPILKKSAPFQKPALKNNQYIFKNWIPITTVKHGTWL